MSETNNKVVPLHSSQVDKPENKEESHAKTLTLNEEELKFVESGKEFIKLLEQKQLDVKRIIETLEYEKELKYLQIELNKLQSDIIKNNRRVVVIYEGRDAAGKGGTIRRFTQHLNPRDIEVVALTKPNETERGQWYFQRYIQRLPAPGTIVFFDRSWYNRAVVEPVMGFCTKAEYDNFIIQVPEFENMLHEDGIELIKFWFSISKEEQEKRFKSRRKNPLKQWKMSPVDEKAQELWNTYTFYKQQMFAHTHTPFSPWIIIQADNKRRARLESMRYMLSKLKYEGKENASISLRPDPKIVLRYNHSRRLLE
jgi:polyphosphate kinase 2